MRPIVLPPSLSLLDGPRTGVVELPVHLDWTPTNLYDLSSPQRVRTLCSTVLENALNPEDFRYLNRDTLRETWAVLRLPRNTRAVWESAFPSLAADADESRWENEGGHPA